MGLQSSQKAFHFELLGRSTFELTNTVVLTEFNVYVMTRNNGAHQPVSYDPGIQK